MNTHTLILKCTGLPTHEVSNLESFLESRLRKGRMEYFGRNGLRLYSDPNAIMESLKGKFFIQVSFGHLLQLDSVHALAVIRAALKSGMVKMVKRASDGFDVVLP